MVGPTCPTSHWHVPVKTSTGMDQPEHKTLNDKLLPTTIEGPDRMLQLPQCAPVTRKLLQKGAPYTARQLRYNSTVELARLLPTTTKSCQHCTSPVTPPICMSTAVMTTSDTLKLPKPGRQSPATCLATLKPYESALLLLVSAVHKLPCCRF